MLFRLVCTAPTQPCPMKSHAGAPRSRSKTASPPLSSIQLRVAPSLPWASWESAFNQTVIGKLEPSQKGSFNNRTISELSFWNRAHMKNFNAKKSALWPLQPRQPTAPTMSRSTRHSLTREMSLSKSPAASLHRTLHRIKLIQAALCWKSASSWRVISVLESGDQILNLVNATIRTLRTTETTSHSQRPSVGPKYDVFLLLIKIVNYTFSYLFFLLLFFAILHYITFANDANFDYTIFKLLYKLQTFKKNDGKNDFCLKKNF